MNTIDETKTDAYRQLEKALEQSEERYRILIDSMSDVVMRLSPLGNVIYVSPNIKEFGGYIGEDEIGNHMSKYIEEKTDLVRALDLLKNTLLDKKSGHFEFLFKPKEGKPFHVEHSYAPIIVENKVVAFQLVLRNITERRQAEEALRENEEKYRILFDSAKDALFLLDPDKGFIDANHSALSMFQIASKSEFVKLGPVAVSPEFQPDGSASLQSARAHIDKALKEGLEFFEWDHKKQDGTVFPATVLLACFEFAGRKLLLATVRNITERKQAEEKLRQMDNLKSIGTLAGGIAHDFNNILTGLYGNIELAKLNITQEHPSFDFLEEAENSMNRAARLTKQLLTFAKGGTPIKKVVSIRMLLEEVVSFDLSGSNVKPVFRQSEKIWRTEIDRGQIQQVFSNLTINANQATPDGGRLYISLENIDIADYEIADLQPGKYVKVTVQDEGIGIDTRHLDRIFDPYFTTKQSGNGLGLATTYSIIQKHHGHIEVESELGKGSTFTVYLPAAKTQNIEEVEQSETKAATTKQSARILVMDDDKSICQLVSKMLTSLGYWVEAAFDGEAAIDKYREAIDNDTPFDVIIMDLTIPGGMGGKEAIKHILEMNPEAKVIVSSGYSSDPIMANHLDYGFQGIIAKPYLMSKLEETLLDVLEK
ncbi:MAG: PAS domain S-box protein [Candidatus Cloacimonetes bacterium]|nr:PAS domain S-box protein [Candidatus Cloacimonadota bacterium]